jgi:hypothetical protein
MITWSLVKVLTRNGLEQCPECKSWIRKTAAARTFHYRRCAA